jgi:hypothetical protein
MTFKETFDRFRSLHDGSAPSRIKHGGLICGHR